MIEQIDSVTWRDADGFTIRYHGDTGIYECLTPDGVYIDGFRTLEDAMIHTTMWSHDSDH